MSNPPSNKAYSLTYHNPVGGNLVMFVALVPTDIHGNNSGQPFMPQSDSIGNVVETDPAGNPMSQDANAGFPKSIGSYTYTGGQLQLYMVGVSSRAPLLSANGSFIFNGYFNGPPTNQFTGNLKALMQRGLFLFGPASQGSNYFFLDGACIIALAPPVKN